jgi:hypothetical protein
MGLLTPLRRWRPVDWLLTRWESYWSLSDQLGVAPYVEAAVRFAIAAVLGGWAYVTVEALPIAIACVIVVFAALTSTSAVRALARRQVAAGSSDQKRSPAVTKEHANALVGREELQAAVQPLSDANTSVIARLDRIENSNQKILYSLGGRSVEILIDKMLRKLERLQQPYVIEAVFRGDREAYLESVERLFKDVDEQSRSWPPTRHFLPFEATLAAAETDCRRDLHEMPDDLKLSAKEMELLRKSIFVRHALELTEAFLKVRRDDALARQTDLVPNPYTH